MLRRGLRAPSHPDHDEARERAQDEVDRLRALSYHALLRLRDTPRHHPFVSSTGRQLVGETCVHRDGLDEGPLRILVDVWEPRRWRIARCIASEDFVRAPDGRSVGE